MECVGVPTGFGFCGFCTCGMCCGTHWFWVLRVLYLWSVLGYPLVFGF